VFESAFHPRRDLALRYAKGSAPAPVAPPNRAIQNPGANSPLDKIWGQGQMGSGSIRCRLHFGCGSPLVSPRITGLLCPANPRLRKAGSPKASFPSGLRWSSRWRWMSLSVRRLAVARGRQIFL
jgi:hypothetical protein